MIGRTNELKVYSLKSLKLKKSFTDHTDKIIKIASSLDGKLILTTSLDESIIIIDIDSLKSVNTLHHKALCAVFSNTSEFIASAC